MILLELIAVLSTLLLVVFNFIIYLTLNRIKDVQLQDNNEYREISVLVAAKNEVNNVEKLVAFLSKIDYPENKFEVLIGDDKSTDGTFKRLTELTKDNTRFQVIQFKNKTIPGKKGVLQQLLDKAKFDYVLITDADSEVPRDWLKYYSHMFSLGYRFVFGQVISNKRTGFVNSLARFENLRSKMLNFTLAKLNLPFSTGGANIGYRKELIEYIGGYEKISPVLSGDDDLLITELRKNNIKFGFIPNLDCAVNTNTKEKFGEYLNQKARHTTTSIHYSLLHKLLLVLWHVPNISVLFSALLIPWNDLFILPLLLKLLLDTFNLSSHQEEFDYKFNLLEQMLLTILYEIQLIVIFSIQFRYKNRWD